MNPDVKEPQESDPATPAEPARAGLRRRLAARRLLRAEVYYGAGVLAFAALTAAAYFYSYFGWDLWAARALQNLPVPRLHEFMRLASRLGDKWTPYALTGLTMLLFFSRGRKSEALCLLLSTGGSGLANRLFKLLVGRPRPHEDLVSVLTKTDPYSFPSGHVTFYVSYFGFLFFVAFAILPAGSPARRAALLLTATPVLLIGLSRVVLGAHWPSDILGAYLMSGLWLAFSLDVYRRWKQRKGVMKAEG